MTLRKFLHRFTHRPVKSAEDFWRKSILFGEINEFFKHPVFSIDTREHTLPFLTNPSWSKKEHERWRTLESMHYEYGDENDRVEADRRFEGLWKIIGPRLNKNWSIFDVGCNTGYFLQKFHDMGFCNLHGIDPQEKAVAYAREHRPHLDIQAGFFGPPKNDVVCDVLVMFKSIFRIPYQAGLFDAIDRCAKKYVILEGISEGWNFCRDVHVGLGKKGFMCIEKRVVNLDLTPIGYSGIEEYLILLEPLPDRPKSVQNYFSNFVFRRIEPKD